MIILRLQITHLASTGWLPNWIKGHSILQVLFGAYASIIPQVILLLIYLNCRGRCGRGWELIWLFMVSVLTCVVFSAFWPAVGAFGHYNVETSREYVQVFKELYDGTTHVIGNHRVQGIVQFPSFHTALGILMIYVTRGLRIQGLLSVLLTAFLRLHLVDVAKLIS